MASEGGLEWGYAVDLAGMVLVPEVSMSDELEPEGIP